MTPGGALLIALAGFAAGAINAVAGGGSLVSFPALVASGLPPLAANVTNSVAVWPGYVGSVVAYRREVVDQRQRLAPLGATAAGGAVLGTVLLLRAPADVFEAVVPVLVLFGCALLAVQPRVAAAVARRAADGRGGAGTALYASTFVAATYGAYFGGGLGVVLLAVLGSFLADHLQRTNALKSALSLIINAVALLAFVLFAPVDWTAVAIVAPASLLGGYLGAGVARRLGPGALRWSVIAFGVVVAVWLALR